MQFKQKIIIRQTVSLSIVWIAFDATEIRRIKTGPNVNELKSLFELICITFGAWKIQCLMP